MQIETARVRDRAERYRRQAERVRREAASVYDPGARQQLLDIAGQYERLAATIERLPPPRQE